jgi:hypothetical protein
MDPEIPSIVFIVPYRNRENDLKYFKQKMQYIMSDIDPATYKIHVIHQKDNRPFNRGAIKNIGFLYIKEKYPEHWKQMTIVFNDVDTTPSIKNMFNYSTKKGIIKHFYGFDFALGGIFSITGEDFEMLNGFPNFWGWGYEDTALNVRAIKRGVVIDRSNFVKYLEKNVEQISNEIFKKINYDEKRHFKTVNTNGINHLTNVHFVENNEEGFIDVYSFETGMTRNVKADFVYNISVLRQMKPRVGWKMMGYGHNDTPSYATEAEQRPVIHATVSKNMGLVMNNTVSSISANNTTHTISPHKKMVELGGLSRKKTGKITFM